MMTVSVSLVMLPVMILGITCLMMRHIYIIIPLIMHEIDRLATCIILTTVLAPVLLMTRRYVHIDRLINYTGRRGLNHNGPSVDELGLRSVSDVNAAIKTGLADAYRHTDIGCVR